MPNHQEYRTVGSALVSFFLERKRKPNLDMLPVTDTMSLPLTKSRLFLILSGNRRFLAHRRGNLARVYWEAISFTPSAAWQT